MIDDAFPVFWANGIAPGESQALLLQKIEEHRVAFYTGIDDQMSLQRTEEDGLGYIHYHYQQT